MSDVGDVNRIHSRDDSTIEAYIRAARKMLSPTASMADRMAFMALHSAKNVILLANVIEALRAENSQLMETLYGGEVDSEE